MSGRGGELADELCSGSAGEVADGLVPYDTLTGSGPATSATGPACATSPSTPATRDGHRINEVERQAVLVGIPLGHVAICG